MACLELMDSREKEAPQDYGERKVTWELLVYMEILVLLVLLD